MLQKDNSLNFWKYLGIQGLLILIFSLLTVQLCAQVMLRGVVVDHTRNTLPGATVCTYPDTICTVSNEYGAFELVHKRWPQRIEVTYVGYEKKVIELSPFFEQDHFHIILRPSVTGINEVIIQEHRLRSDAFQPTTIVGGDYFDNRTEGNLAASLSALPGVNHINVGLGIGKPVIRGLYSNRLIVTDQGVKQEGHQWGIDHGLEIDQFRARRVEVIKGPSSLEHGSDGLGGVLRILPDPIAATNSLQASVSLLGKSNNDHVGGNIFIAGSGNHFFGSANLSHQAFSDYRVPSDKFVYNTFELPLFNQQLKNTAGKESSFSITSGYRDEKNLARISVSQYRQHAGIFAGAVGIPQSYILQDDGDSRNIEFPSQRVNHQRAVAFFQHHFSQRRKIELSLGIQENHRREFSFPEFHAIQDRSDINQRLALEMRLRTISLDLAYSLVEEIKIGFNIQHQNNEIGGFDYFLPPFRTLRAGVFGFRYINLNPWFKLKAGMRLDYGFNQSDEAGRDVWNTSGEVIGQLRSEATEHHFFNYAASMGFIQKFEKMDNLEFFGHLGKSFRIPYPVETSSNGVHHGSFRHELGRTDLNAEHGYQLDAGFRFFNKRGLVSVTPFFNFFKDYIYLRPSAEFSPLPDAGQLYRYEQHDAVFSGFEIEWEYQMSQNLNISQSFESVWSYNLDTRLPLPFSPPHTFHTALEYSIELMEGRVQLKSDLSHRWVLSQDRVDRNELSTPSYHLLQGGIQIASRHILAGASLSFRCHNILDVNYLNHLSRYRQLGIPEQGRNFVMRLNIPLHFTL